MTLKNVDDYSEFNRTAENRNYGRACHVCLLHKKKTQEEEEV